MMLQTLVNVSVCHCFQKSQVSAYSDVYTDDGVCEHHQFSKSSLFRELKHSFNFMKYSCTYGLKTTWLCSGKDLGLVLNK